MAHSRGASLRVLLLALALSLSLPGAQIGNSQWCGTQSPRPAEARALEDFEQVLRHAGLSSPKAHYFVPIIWHNIYWKLGPITRGYLSVSKINKQLLALNQAFPSSQTFSFYVEQVHHIENNDWFDGCKKKATRTEIAQALGRDQDWALNVYSCDLHDDFLSEDGALGLGYLPSPSPRIEDGVWLHYKTIPGSLFGEWKKKGRGDVGVHEVGHYLGLYHTFYPWTKNGTTNGCKGNGDFVDDTPAEKRPQWECKPRDSCSSAGADPIHNFMDYTTDKCRDHFTTGQMDRMKERSGLWRSQLGDGDEPNGFVADFNEGANGWIPWPTRHWRLGNNSLQMDLGNRYTWHRTPYSDIRLDARIKTTWASATDNSPVVCLAVRHIQVLTDFDSWSNGYHFCYSTGYGADAQSVWVTKYVNWQKTQLAVLSNVAAVRPGPVWTRVKVVARGSELRLLINGQLVWTGQDPDLTWGYVGIYAKSEAVPGERLLIDWASLKAY